jgi:hypothetical protein
MIGSQAIDDSGNAQNIPAEDTVTIPIRVPLDQQTIQSAINFANDGDTVLVAPEPIPKISILKGRHSS